MDAALRGTNQACAEVARPTADLVVPTLSEHNMAILSVLSVAMSCCKSNHFVSAASLRPFGESITVVS